MVNVKVWRQKLGHALAVQSSILDFDDCTYICNQIVATLCALCGLVCKHSGRGIMLGCMLLFYICVCAFQQNLSCTIIPLTAWEPAARGIGNRLT